MKINKIILPCLSVCLMLPINGNMQQIKNYNKTQYTKMNSNCGQVQFENATNFEINGFDYVTDYREERVYARGDTIDYHALDLWTAIYKKYDSVSDTMYYCVLAYPEINTNTKDIGVYRIVTNYLNTSISSKFWSADPYTPNNSVSLGKFAPTEEGYSQCSESYGFSVGAEGGEGGAKINGSISFSTDIIKSNVSLVLNKEYVDNSPYKSEAKNRFIEFSFQLQGKYQTKINGLYPYRGLFGRNIYAIYIVKNYTALKDRSARVYFYIDSKASSIKYNKMFQCSCVKMESFLHREYCITL